MGENSTAVVGVCPATTADGIGRMILVCEQMEVYMNWSLWDIHRLFLPPVCTNQYRIFNYKNRDVGFVTWAKLSPEASQFIERRHFDPRPYEWASGNRLWFIDLVCEPDYVMRAVYWLNRSLFTESFVTESGIDPTYPAKAIRRREDRSVRRIAHFCNLKSSSQNTQN